LHYLTPEDLWEQQPLLFADRFVMLFDGRIDNRRELGECLGIVASGEVPDSVIAVRLFDRFGERSFARILGDFAIIVMDLQDKKLICARDHLGLRVLHYYHSPTLFAVATAPEVLFALKGVPKILNREKVGDTLIRRGLNPETTYYHNINRVLPGGFIQISGAQLSKDLFWNPLHIQNIYFKHDEEYLEAFQEHLNQAVKARLRSTRVPCALITGGLDSSSISIIAADMLGSVDKKLTTYTAVPEPGFYREELRGHYFDETPYVLEIAKANRNLRTNFVPPSNGSILEQIAEQIRFGGAPSGGILNGLWVMAICARARSAGHNVMLGGEMGNLIMSYHGRGLFTELLRKGQWLRLIGELRASGYQWKKILRQWIIGPYIPAPIFRKYKEWRRGGKAEWYEYPIKREFVIESDLIERMILEDSALDAPQYRNTRFGRINDFRCYSETADWFAKLRAGFGIDSRTPAFDRRLVEFCIGIPEDQYLRNGCDRWLIRRAMKGRLPDSILYKRKYGAQAADWFPRLTRERRQITARLEQLSNNTEVASIVDLPRLISIFADWPKEQPQDYSKEQAIMLSIPQALGIAIFVENVTGTGAA
jgi:asparagine synthase (glutamine-hydrolysing)